MFQNVNFIEDVLPRGPVDSDFIRCVTLIWRVNCNY